MLEEVRVTRDGNLTVTPRVKLGQMEDFSGSETYNVTLFLFLALANIVEYRTS